MSVKNFAYRIVKKTLRRVPPGLLRLRPYTIYAIPTSRFDEEIPVPEAPPGETIRWVASRQDAALLQGLAGQDNLDGWDGAAQRAAVTLHGDKPVACVWVAEKDYVEEELALRYELAAGDRWVYAAHVLTDARGAGVYGRLLRFVGGQLKSEGVQRLVSGVVNGNRASLRAKQRWRPEPIGWVFAARSLGATLCVAKGHVRRGGLLPVKLGGPMKLRIS